MPTPWQECQQRQVLQDVVRDDDTLAQTLNLSSPEIAQQSNEKLSILTQIDFQGEPAGDFCSLIVNFETFREIFVPC